MKRIEVPSVLSRRSLYYDKNWLLHTAKIRREKEKRKKVSVTVITQGLENCIGISFYAHIQFILLHMYNLPYA